MIIDRIAFRNLLDEGERIVYVAHVHPFLIYPVLFKVLLFSLLIPAAGYLLFPPLWTIWLGWASLGAVVFFYRLFEWYMSAWVVTDCAVIHLEWNSPFDRSASRIEYGTVETITTEIKGFWGTVMRFGNLRIDNVSANPVILYNVTKPHKVERIIMEHQSKYVHSQAVRDHGQLKELLTTLLRSTGKKG